MILEKKQKIRLWKNTKFPRPLYINGLINTKLMHHPDYKKIYLDILNAEYPDKISRCRNILQKDELSSMDVISLNEIIFGVKSQSHQKHKSYDKSAILEILIYQKKHKYNNSQLAEYFNLSRNTVAKWRKMFLV
ncbi:MULTISPECIES: helix-turn-helix domain-containing protein [Chryseobacterium]|nr:helix-turn-helix domain-containing protein [Chryseobacterium lathyri]